MTATTTYWRCYAADLPPHVAADCHEGGVYEQAGSGGAAERHTSATGHPTTTSLRPIPTKETP